MTEADPAMVPLQLFNSWSRQKEVFKPIDPHVVRLYSCGPTVYSYAHLGNLRAYIFTDVLRRTLNWKGWDTEHVINITDVGHLTSDQDEGEDKLELAARREKADVWAIAAHYTGVFKEDLAQLNILPPSLWSTATDHIQEMIAFARRLDDGGYTYRLPSGLYFDTSRVPDYGYLARADAQGQREGARVEAIEGKRNNTDFAIWRTSSPDQKRQMEWLSPWGAGAPGWHLECSVMSMKYLGAQFDIHTGGIDHREIHHCNEIAQNQAYTGSNRTGANWWMHNSFLIDRTGKMSKSKGDFTTLAKLTARGVPPLAYRLLCLSGHYRTDIDLSVPVIQAAMSRLIRLVRTIASLRDGSDDDGAFRADRETGFTRGASFGYQRGALEAGLSAKGKDIVARFDAAISDDLMTPRILPLLDEAVDSKDLPKAERLRIVGSFDLVLGLKLLDLKPSDLNLRPASAAFTAPEVEELLNERQRVRQAKDFAHADAIRDQLTKGGVDVMDGDMARWAWRPDIGDF